MATRGGFKKETLLEISAAWDALGATIALGAADKILAQKFQDLNHLAHGEFVEAIKIMGAVATDDVRLRFALSIALIRAGRFIEAQDLLQALARGDADPRVHLYADLWPKNSKRPMPSMRL